MASRLRPTPPRRVLPGGSAGGNAHAAALAVPSGLAAVPDVAGAAALLFLVGGLAMLTLILVLLLVQTLLTKDVEPESERRAPSARHLRPVATPLGQPLPPPGRGTGPASTRLPTDRSIERLIRRGLGEPRVLSATRAVTHVRLYGCRTCTTARSTDQGGCSREEAALAESFALNLRRQVEVHETRCARLGHDHCEFEVSHA